MDAIREGIADGEAGNEQPFEQFAAEARAVRVERRMGEGTDTDGSRNAESA